MTYWKYMSEMYYTEYKSLYLRLKRTNLITLEQRHKGMTQ